jgi:hypothetical protein
MFRNSRNLEERRTELFNAVLERVTVKDPAILRQD